MMNRKDETSSTILMNFKMKSHLRLCLWWKGKMKPKSTSLMQSSRQAAVLHPKTSKTLLEPIHFFYSEIYKNKLT